MVFLCGNWRDLDLAARRLGPRRLSRCSKLRVQLPWHALVPEVMGDELHFATAKVFGLRHAAPCSLPSRTAQSCNCAADQRQSGRQDHISQHRAQWSPPIGEGGSRERGSSRANRLCTCCNSRGLLQTRGSWLGFYYEMINPTST